MCQYCVHIDEVSAIALVWVIYQIERHISISAAIQMFHLIGSKTGYTYNALRISAVKIWNQFLSCVCVIKTLF